MNNKIKKHQIIYFLYFISFFILLFKKDCYAQFINKFNYLTNKIGNEITVLNNDFKKVFNYNKNNNEIFYEIKEPNNNDTVLLCKSNRQLDNKLYNYRIYDLDGKYKNLEFETFYAYEIYYDTNNYIFNVGNKFVVFNMNENSKKVIENVSAFRYYYKHYIFSNYTEGGIYPGLKIYDENFKHVRNIDNYQDINIIEHDEDYYDWFINVAGENYYKIQSYTSDGVNIINKNMELVFPDAFFEVKSSYKTNIIDAMYKGNIVYFDFNTRTVLNVIPDYNYILSEEKEKQLNEKYGDKIDKIEYDGEIEDRYIRVSKKDKSKDIYTKSLILISSNADSIEYKKLNKYIFTSSFGIVNVLDENFNKIKSLQNNYSDVVMYEFGDKKIYIFKNDDNDFVDVYNDDFSKSLLSVRLFTKDTLEDGFILITKEIDSNKNFDVSIYDFDLNTIKDKNGNVKKIKKAREIITKNVFGQKFYYKMSITSNNDSEIFDKNLNTILDGFSTADFDSFNDKLVVYFYKNNLIRVYKSNFTVLKEFENSNLFESIKVDVTTRQHFVVGKKNIQYNVLCMNNLYYILDENFNIKISNLQNVEEFNVNYFKFIKDEKIGYMNYNGNILYEMKY